MTQQEKNQLFAKEFYPLADSLYNFAYRFAPNEDDAYDLVQETYLKAYRFIEKYKIGTNPKAWLFRILRNTFINNYRKNAKEPNKVDYQEVERLHSSDAITYTSASEVQSQPLDTMLGDEITLALNQLPVDFRVIILLADIEDFSYEEIAKIVDIPIGTVRSRLHRARLLLRDKLKKYAKTMGYQHA